MFDNRSYNRREPDAVKLLLIANIAAFFIQELFLKPAMGMVTLPGIGFAPKYLYTFGFVPSLGIGSGWVWQFVTHMFLHGGLGHIFLNMFALYMFGPHIERHIGKTRFLFLYFACGFGAALLQALLSYGANIPMIGASGAVMGIAAAFAYFFPNSVLLVFGLIPVKAWKVILFYAVFEFFSIFSMPGSPIAHAAHFGGLAVSLVILQLLYRKYSLPGFGKPASRETRQKPPQDNPSSGQGSDRWGNIIELEKDRDGWWR